MMMMRSLIGNVLITLSLWSISCLASLHLHPHDQSGLSINDVPWHRREHWMRLANEATYTDDEPCPQAPFGSAIVNTTSDELICVAANAVGKTGDPTLHGEMTAIRMCHEVLQNKGLSVKEILSAWKDFSIYTNGEPCPMCMSAIRWAGFKEVIYGTSIESIAKAGRNQIYISSSDILEKSYSMGHMTLMLGNVLSNETDPFFAHQFNESAPCPIGCERQHVEGKRVKACQALPNWKDIVEKQRKGEGEPKTIVVNDEYYDEQDNSKKQSWFWQT